MYHVIVSVFDVHTTTQIKIHNSSVSLKPTHNNKLRTIIGIWIGSMQCLYVPSQLQNTLTKCQTSSRSHVLPLSLSVSPTALFALSILCRVVAAYWVRSSQVTKVHEIYIPTIFWMATLHKTACSLTVGVSLLIFLSLSLTLSASILFVVIWIYVCTVLSVYWFRRVFYVHGSFLFFVQIKNCFFYPKITILSKINKFYWKSFVLKQKKVDS